MTAFTTPSRRIRAAPGPGPRNSRPPGADFVGELARHAMGWHQRSLTESQVLQAITDSAVDLIFGARGATILATDGTGELIVRAATGPLSAMLLVDCSAYRWRTGPDHILIVDDASSPDRWPIVTTRSGEGEISCAPLGSGRTMFGTLILATDHPRRSDGPISHLIPALAMLASTALAAARDRANLQTALSTRDVIGQAKGILMERLCLTAEDAFTTLVNLSQTNNTNLRDLSRQLADTGEIPGRH